MEYKGYTAEITFDVDDEILHGRVKNIRDVISFEGTSVEEVRAEFQASVDDYLAFCIEKQREPDSPSMRYVDARPHKRPQVETM